MLRAGPAMFAICVHFLLSSVPHVKLEVRRISGCQGNQDKQRIEIPPFTHKFAQILNFMFRISGEEDINEAFYLPRSTTPQMNKFCDHL